MRPSLNLVFIVLAIIVSLLIGLMIGGGPAVWLTNQVEGGSPGNNSNASLPVVPQNPTPRPVATETPAATRTTVAPTATIPPVTPSPTSTVTETAEPEVIVETPTPIVVAEPTPEVTPEPTPIVVRVTVISAGIRLRATPQGDGAIVATLVNGEEAIALQRSPDDSWLEVEVSESGARGWLFADPSLVAIEGELDAVPILES